MQRFLDGLSSGSPRSTPSPRKTPSTFQVRKAATPLCSRTGKIQFAIEDEEVSDDEQSNVLENSNNSPISIPTKVRKIEGGPNESDDRDDIILEGSSNSSFIVDENTNKIDDRDEISTDPLDENNQSQEKGDLSSAKSSSSTYSSSSSSCSSSLSSASSSSSSSSLQPFSFLNKIDYEHENNAIPTTTVESSWLQAVNGQISLKRGIVQNKVPSSSSSAAGGEPFHKILETSMSVSSIPHSHVNIISFIIIFIIN